MLTADYNRSAKKELFDSSLYYSKQAPGLGERFLKEVEISIREIGQSPKRYPKHFEDIHRCIMPHFPYGIYYRIEGMKIRILAVAHASRHPDYWKHRH